MGYFRGVCRSFSWDAVKPAHELQAKAQVGLAEGNHHPFVLHSEAATIAELPEEKLTAANQTLHDLQGGVGAYMEETRPATVPLAKDVGVMERIFGTGNQGARLLSSVRDIPKDIGDWLQKTPDVLTSKVNLNEVAPPLKVDEQPGMLACMLEPGPTKNAGTGERTFSGVEHAHMLQNAFEE